MRRQLVWTALSMFLVLAVAGDGISSPGTATGAALAPTSATHAAFAPFDGNDRPTTTSTPPWLVATPVPAPRSVALVGDSGMVDLAPAFEASFAAAGVGKVVNSAWPGFGLTRPGWAWRDEWRALIEREDPSLVVVMLGGWDLRYLESKGVRAYSEIVAEALEVLMARGARVEWLAMLPGGGTYLPPVNTVYSQGPHWSSFVDFFDAQDVLRGPDGSLTRTIPTPQGPVLVRKPDHWHFCPVGAALVAAATHQHLAELGWVPPTTPGWEHASWRDRKDIYDQPRGACDAPSGVALG